MTLSDELERAAEAASALAPAGATLAAVLPSEPGTGVRRYLCGFEEAGGGRRWVVLDAALSPLREQREIRDAVGIAALCEIAEESAAGGDLDELLGRLVALRLAEAPEGIEEAEEAVRALQRTIGTPPHVASPGRLDAIGLATRRLEQALDPAAPSPFTAALKAAHGVVDALTREVEGSYLVELGEPPP